MQVFVEELGLNRQEINLLLSTLGGDIPSTIHLTTANSLAAELSITADDSQIDRNKFGFDTAAPSADGTRPFRLRDLALKVSQLHDEQAQALHFFAAGFTAGVSHAIGWNG